MKPPDRLDERMKTAAFKGGFFVSRSAASVKFGLALFLVMFTAEFGGECQAAPPEALAGTAPWEQAGDMAAVTVAGVDRFLLRALERSIAARSRHWRRDLGSPEAYSKSVEANRLRFARIIGLRDQRPPFDSLEFLSRGPKPLPLAQTHLFDVFAVRWPALDGISGEGLLLEPNSGRPTACVVAIPDCAQSPEMLAGLMEGVARDSQFARRLAENGCRVIVPSLIDRRTDLSVIAEGTRRGNVTHREMLYRAAYQMGRHLIGYEVQKVLAAVDWFITAPDEAKLPLGVMGYGEGGLVAMYAAAADERLAVAGISGYFDSRQDIWQEPIDRNVFGLLDEFGDAEIGSLITPRAVLVEACAFPDVHILPGAASAPARLATPAPARVRAELARLEGFVQGMKPAPTIELVVSGEGTGPFGTPPFIEKFLRLLGRRAVVASQSAPVGQDVPGAIEVRRNRQFHEISAINEKLVDEGSYARQKFMEKLDAGGDLEAYVKSTAPYRDYLARHIVGRWDDERSPPNPRSRLKYDAPEFRGYEIVLDVFPDVILYGILLVPKEIKPGERRSVVVCQHGLEGRAEHTIEGDRTSYRDFAARLAREGFITFSPQHLYNGGDAFRTLQRKSNPLGKTLFSTMTAQHRQLLSWLATLEFVDSDRIAFYGISYGGKSAMRIPALVDGYALSICSSDFCDWIWRTVSNRFSGGYLVHGEYEIFEFDLGNTFNYAELAALICPRPFMVERFHGRDMFTERKLAEFAKARLLYESLNLGDRIAIAWFANFQPPSEYRRRETFDFLHKHLNWP